MKRALLFLFFAAAPTDPSTTKALPPPNRFQFFPDATFAPINYHGDSTHRAAMIDTATGEVWYACGALANTPAWCPMPRLGGTEVKP